MHSSERIGLPPCGRACALRDYRIARCCYYFFVQKPIALEIAYPAGGFWATLFFAVAAVARSFVAIS